MINSDSSSTNSWLPTHNIVDSLNQVMDSVSVLSDAELQKELSIFANAQFTYDVAPGAALGEEKSNEKEKQYRRESNKQPNMHSLLNVKLASLAEHNYHTTMTPDAIDSYYNQSPDCSPPNGYYSPNPSPPNGFHSPNPTPPNGYMANNNSPAVFNGIQGIVNPPITFYGDETVMGYDEDQFMKTMNILTSSYNEAQQYDHLDSRPAVPSTEKRRSSSVRKQRSNSVSANSNSTTTTKKSSPLSKKELPAIDSDAEDEDVHDHDHENEKKNPLTKEDKRRRNTAASARFRVKKKLREQALQQTAQEMTEKAKAFENRVHELEREVKWLKALIVERKDGRLEQMIMQQQQQQQHHHHQQQHREVHYQQQYRPNVSGHHHVAASAMANSNNGYLPVDYHGQQQQ